MLLQHDVCCCIRIASIKQKLGLYTEAVELYNSILLQSADYVPALQGAHSISLFSPPLTCALNVYCYSVNCTSLYFYLLHC